MVALVSFDYTKTCHFELIGHKSRDLVDFVPSTCHYQKSSQNTAYGGCVMRPKEFTDSGSGSTHNCNCESV